MSLPPQTITRTSPAHFTVKNRYQDLKDPQEEHSIPLSLNFQPLLAAASDVGFGPDTPLVMIHFQARPKDLRRWGLYDSESDTYHSFDSDDDLDTEGLNWSLLSIPDSFETLDVIPTCVFVAYGVRFNPDDQTLESVD